MVDFVYVKDITKNPHFQELIVQRKSIGANERFKKRIVWYAVCAPIVLSIVIASFYGDPIGFVVFAVTGWWSVKFYKQSFRFAEKRHKECHFEINNRVDHLKVEGYTEHEINVAISKVE